MKKITVKNTYNIKISGAPSQTLLEANSPKTVAVCPNSIPYIKPKLLVKIGDSVKIGSPVFMDKKHPELTFVSPGAGKVSDIKYGPKRIIEEVVITLDASEDRIELTSLRPGDISDKNRDDIKQALLVSGLWSLLREYPFKRIPSPETTPPSIYVSCDMDEAFSPDSHVLYNRYLDDFKVGLSVLNVLSGGKVNVGVSGKSTAKGQLSALASHELNGAYPANNPGVFLYHNKKDSSENNAWGLFGYDVIRIGQLFNNGTYPTERIISVAGPRVKEPAHVIVREGSDLASIITGKIEGAHPTRLVAGGLLTGRTVDESGHLWQEDKSINVISEGKEPEMLAFFKPGFDKPTFGNTYLSALLPNTTFDMTSNLNGGERACIACLECPKVCPTNILPQFLMKSIRAGDVEESVALGLLDCVECGLCTYVCPSKIELDDIIHSAKVALEKEV